MVFLHVNVKHIVSRGSLLHPFEVLRLLQFQMLVLLITYTQLLLFFNN